MTEDRSPVGRLFGAIVPRAVDAIDANELVETIDLDALLERIDINELLERIDMERLLERVDVERIIQRVDVDGIIGRVDLDGLMGRIDVNALMARVDIDQLLAGVDMPALVARAGIDDIVAEATTGMAARTIDLVRRQLIGIDLIVLRAVDRVLRRGRQPMPAGSLSPTGRPAGPISRLLAFGIDAALVSVLFTFAVSLGKSLVELFTGDAIHPTDASAPLWAVAYFGWWGAYLWVSLEIAGRTPGKALVGMRVQGVDGQPLGPGRALARVIAFPFSFILGLGFIPGVVRTDRRAFHDLVARSQEVVDWGDRRAELPSALERWVVQHRPPEAPALDPLDPSVTGSLDAPAT